MSNSGDQKDYLQPHSYTNNSFPQGLNVLNILTYIGAGLQVLGSVFGYIMAPYNVKKLEEMKDMQKSPVLKGMSGFFKWSNDATLKQYEHRTELLILSVVCAAVCLYGVFEMRKLKKQGFVLYSVGEFIFPLATLLLIGFWSAIFGLLVALLFVILYAAQRKHFTN